jgi:glyoxylase-like metal-dependent hydrolase (beta-lactamase superfamily II)
MKVKYFLGGFDNNLSYLIWCESSHKAALVDASTEITEIIECIEAKHLVLEKILITHTHFDHIKYLYDLVYHYPKVQICGHINPEEKMGENYRGLNHHEVISIGMEMVTVLHTPGHFPDSVCFWNKKNDYLFTGDTVFVGRTGRTIGKKSNISHLYNSVYNEILNLPEETMVYPGHHYGYKVNITLKENINLSSFFQCNSEDEFILVMTNYEKNR